MREIDEIDREIDELQAFLLSMQQKMFPIPAREREIRHDTEMLKATKQCHIELDEEKFNDLSKILRDEPNPNQLLKRLFSKPLPWDQ